MIMSLTERLAALVELSCDGRTLKKLVLSKPSDKEVVKVVCELHKIAESTVV